jgi:hypothetical protein
MLPLALGTFLVLYPSRSVQRFSGKFGLLETSEYLHPAVVDYHGSVYILDPRAIVRRQPEGEILYAPSTIPASRHAPEFRGWLKEHPEWEREWVVHDQRG